MTLKLLRFLLLPALLLMPVGAAFAQKTSPETEARLEELMAQTRRSNGIFSPLEAVAASDIAVLKARIADGTNLNEAGEDGNSPLHLAALGNNPRMVKLLLDAGVDPEAKDAQGRTALEVCRHPKSRNILERVKGHRQKEIEADAHARAGNVKALRNALKNGLNPNAPAANLQQALVFSAIEAGQVEVVKLFICHGAKLDGKTSAGGYSVLHVAVRAPRNRAELVSLLIKNGADPLAKAGNGVTPLHDAAWFGNVDAVKALLPHYKDVNFNPAGKSSPDDLPINSAIFHGGDETVQAFIDAGLDPNDPRFAKKPPLVFAARCGRKASVKRLLEAGADKNARDEHGKTAADYASPEIAELLR